MDENRGNALLQGEIDRRVQFVTKHLAFGESHMVDFFVWDHWNTLIHPDVRAQLLQCDENDLFSVKRMCSRHGFTNSGSAPDAKHAITDLKTYFEEARNCAVESSRVCVSLTELKKQFCKTSTIETGAVSLLSTKEYMCNKKSHEVEEMSGLVNLLCQNFGLSRVLDLGAGKGYLGTYLSLKYGLEVIGVDCSASNSSGALLRSKKFLRYWNAHLKNKTEDKLYQSDMKYEPLTVQVDADTDISSVFGHGDTVNPVASGESGVMLTALHACGDLSSTALRTFVGKREMRSACVVGCCYHILTSDEADNAEQGFPMSDYLRQKKFTMQRNTKMLGLKAPDRIETADTAVMEEKSIRSLFYRAVLSVILEKEFGMDSSTKELRVGKEYSKSRDFVDYVRRCFKRLKIGEEKCISVTDESIASYFQSMEPRRKSLLAFNILREAFGPAVEALILLDKLLYLKEQKYASTTVDSYLVRLFDPVKSPRCYALVAMKK